MGIALEEEYAVLKSRERRPARAGNGTSRGRREGNRKAGGTMREEDRPLYAALERRLRAARLGRVCAAVLQIARPAIRLELARAEEEDAIPVGNSKVGGAPDLPPDVAWPVWQGGPLPFLAQIRLEEVAALNLEGDLPHRGLLSFFYTPNDPDGELRVEEDPTAWRVLYDEDATRVERRPLPAELASGFETSFSACAVAYSRRLTLPDSTSVAVEALGLTNDERLSYINLVTGVGTDVLVEAYHRLLGYPYWFEPDCFLEAYLVRNGLERPTAPRNLAEHEQWAHAMAELQEAAEAEWLLLLQIHSNDEAVMSWPEGGDVIFGITRADLEVRDFSRVWVNLDFI